MGVPVPLAARFPPVFDNSPIAYAFALFSLTLMTSIALAHVVSHLLAHRRELLINRTIDNQACPPPGHGVTLLELHRMIVTGLLLTIILGALPDVLTMLAWGEASDKTMWTLLQIDRVCDGLTIVPFLFSAFLSVRAAGAVAHVLGRDPITIDIRPTWGMVRDKLKIMGAVLCIAVGVTCYKAGWS